jgi:hypothetical protein
MLDHDSIRVDQIQRLRMSEAARGDQSLDLSSDASAAPASPEMAREMARFRAALSASRSTAQLKLFDFLAERSADARAPKEIEIALAVFGGDTGLPDGATDSGARVYVHRLRKRIDEFYAGKDGPRLIIPKGEYRLTLQAPDAAIVPQGRFDRAFEALTRPARWHWFALAGMLCLIVAGAVLLPAADSTDDNARRLASTRFWNGLDESTPITLAAGDSFMLAETRDQNRVDRIIRDEAIQSREQLGQHLKSHPESFYRLYDLDLHFAPVSTALAVWDLQASLPPTRSGKVRRSYVLPLSSADGQALRARTVLYVGRLGDLGQLSAAFRAKSKFVPEGEHAVRDLVSGKVHAVSLDGQDATNPAASTDLGTITTLRTPDGRRLMFITGIGDLAIADMVRLVSDPEDLEKLEDRSKQGRFYQALFEVRSVDGIQTERRLIATHPLG